MFFDWKIQLEKVHLTRDLKDDTILSQGIRLPCKNDQGYCDPTTHTQATIVWFPEQTCTVLQAANIHARMIKFHQKYFSESIPHEDINLDQIRTTNYQFRKIQNRENKLTRFQIYPETEFSCKYNKPIYKTQYSEILVEYLRFSKISEKRRTNRWKIKTTKHRECTITRNITYEQRTVWRNSL